MWESCHCGTQAFPNSQASFHLRHKWQIHIPCWRYSLLPLKDNLENLSNVLNLWEPYVCFCGSEHHACTLFSSQPLTPAEPMISVLSLSAGTEISCPEPRLPLGSHWLHRPLTQSLSIQRATWVTLLMSWPCSFSYGGVSWCERRCYWKIQSTIRMWATWSTWVFLLAATGLFTYLRVSQV